MALATVDMDAMEQDNEGDTDIEAKLLQQFSSMGTTDKEVLISEFQKLLGNQLNPATCAFFLDMNNWNLQAGICSYLDYEQPNNSNKTGFSCSIQDVTMGTGDLIPPNTKFCKTWRIENTGSERWPPACNLRFTRGHKLSTIDQVLVVCLGPHETTQVTIELTSPPEGGLYQGEWQMCTPTGVNFGDVVRVTVSVASDAVISDVTQRLSTLSPSNHLLHSNLPTTVCVDTIPINSLSSMRINSETASMYAETPKLCSQITQSEPFASLLHPRSNSKESEDQDMT